MLTADALRAAVDHAGIVPHLEALQRIADANAGTRTTGSAGFDASVEYVAGRLEAAGYMVERQPFTFDDVSSVNVLAERAGSEPSRVVVLGAHLDSVPEGAGINDNGSGVAAVLAIAEALATFEPGASTVRFAFWGAEEPGQRGSAAYVASLDADERATIDGYLNLDIVGSPNFVRFVYDDPDAAVGSQSISDLLAEQLSDGGLAWEPIDLTGKTDHAAFSDAGIPTGGLFTGGTEPKTDAQARAFGGTAGEPADGCIHAACDTIERINTEVLGQMADAAAGALVLLSQ
jgi:aminopeptidase S